MFAGICINSLLRDRHDYVRVKGLKQLVQPLDESQGPHNYSFTTLGSCMEWPLVPLYTHDQGLQENVDLGFLVVMLKGPMTMTRSQLVTL